MLKGTRILFGNDAVEYRNILKIFRTIVHQNIPDIQELIVPAIWESETFLNKIQGETKDQMWTFKDKGNRDCCLIPEVTGIVQQMYNEKWSKELPKPIWLFYEARCYRYEKPQRGRYREFTQFGLEVLGDITPEISEIAINTLDQCVKATVKKYEKKIGVKRGLGYYIEDGIEYECPSLGTQKQIAGGGRYKEGFGWAIGVDRIIESNK